MGVKNRANILLASSVGYCLMTIGSLRVVRVQLANDRGHEEIHECNLNPQLEPLKRTHTRHYPLLCNQQESVEPWHSQV